MRPQQLQDLSSIGMQETGDLNQPLQPLTNHWGLHRPLVCPDGAIVPYAWRCELAGQALSSAVDRTRLALKAFTDQRKRYFPQLDKVYVDMTEPASKKQCVSQSLPAKQEDLSDCKTLSDILMLLEKDVPNLKISTYERLDWLKRASSLPSSANNHPIKLLKEYPIHSSGKLRAGLQSSVAAGKVTVHHIAVIELFFPSVFRAIVSLNPVGSVYPDAVVFFSPDEGGRYIHTRGSSVYHVFRHISEHAALALRYFLGMRPEATLYYLLHWICSYQTLFTNCCSKCGRLLAMDSELPPLLPPVKRVYRHFSPVATSAAQSNSSTEYQSSDAISAYHVSCFP